GFFWLITAQAQTQDVSKIRVEQLSDDQVAKLMADADRRGMTDDQLLQSLGQRGMPAAEQQKLRTRINTLRQGQKGAANTGKSSSTTSTDPTGRQVTGDSTLFPDTLGDGVPDTSRASR